MADDDSTRLAAAAAERIKAVEDAVDTDDEATPQARVDRADAVRGARTQPPQGRSGRPTGTTKA